jgi:hypothetical protein
MACITNQYDLPFRQAVYRCSLHLCVHLHFGTLPNREVSTEADQPKSTDMMMGFTYIMRAWTLGWNPCRISARSSRDAAKFQSIVKSIDKILGCLVCRSKLTFDQRILVLRQTRVKSSVKDDTIQYFSPSGQHVMLSSSFPRICLMEAYFRQGYVTHMTPLAGSEGAQNPGSLFSNKGRVTSSFIISSNGIKHRYAV